MSMKRKSVPGFTSRYNVSRLVYFEEFSSARSAIEREKQIKRWARAKKIALIEENNPGWDDLSDGWVHVSSPRIQTGSVRMQL